jgi:hypothetical protein
MDIHYRQTNIHWNYFLAIESDFEKISRYIEFTEANNNTFSIELARIIMSSVQEIDGIMKKLCPLIVTASNPQNINDYKDIIKENLPDFIIEEVQIPRYGMTSKPWINWNDNEQDNNPFWWKANNKIKHDRTQNFEKANLKNAYNAVGALLITTLYYYKFEIQNQNDAQPINWQDLTTTLKPKSSLFILKDDYYHEPGTWSSVEW